MFKKVKDIKINYKQYGNGQDIVLLHGWGQNIKMMEPIGNMLKDNYRITIVDLPGFGLSEEPNYAFGITDYVDILHELLNVLDVKKPILIGHSFGGRISIIYASEYDVKKVILFGSPCVRHDAKGKKSKAFTVIKKLKIFNPVLNAIKKHVGSVDYRKATPVMRDVLVKTVNQDLSSYAKMIKIPCLLIWGDKDEAVPVSDARELDNLLMNSKLIILPGTHYCYLENIDKVVTLINEFI